MMSLLTQRDAAVKRGHHDYAAFLDGEMEALEFQREMENALSKPQPDGAKSYKEFAAQQERIKSVPDTPSLRAALRKRGLPMPGKKMLVPTMLTSDRYRRLYFKVRRQSDLEAY